MSIISHIEYLLMTHDCVIVPGIGAILCHGVAAHFDERTQMWLPPTRALSFNPELNHTDGLLAGSISRREGITMNAAAAKVRNECTRLKKQLEKEKFVSFGDAGSLLLNRENKLIYTPGDANWLSPDSMWLPSLSLKEVAKDDSGYGRRIAEEAERRRTRRLYGRVAAAVACIAVVLGLGWIVATNYYPQSFVQIASVAPINNVEIVEDEGFFNGEISDIAPSVILAQEPISMPQEPTASDCSDNKYILIVASLSSESEANKFLALYPDIKLGVINSEGRYRVYAAKGKTWDEAARAAYSPELSELFPLAWVCAL